MLRIETNDPRLAEDAISVDTARDSARLRRAVLQHLPKDVTRVIAVFPVEHAEMLMLLHEAVGKELMGEPVADRPPPDYVPPTRE
jgi:hypothetical protein